MLENYNLLYEGQAKRIYSADEDDQVIVHFKDDATAFDGTKRAVIRGKGEVNAQISAHLLPMMANAGIPTHLIDVLSNRDHLCHKVDIIPIEVVVRNVAAGSICRRFGFEEGMILSRPLIEFFYKSDELHDPPMSEEHALLFGWAEAWELAYMRHAAAVVNVTLRSFWERLNVTLVDFKLEFGRLGNGRILLADEITPDGSRLWEKGTMRKLDKDVFRRDLGDLSDTYRELHQRVFAQKD